MAIEITDITSLLNGVNINPLQVYTTDTAVFSARIVQPRYIPIGDLPGIVC